MSELAHASQSVELSGPEDEEPQAVTCQEGTGNEALSGYDLLRTFEKTEQNKIFSNIATNIRQAESSFAGAVDGAGTTSKERGFPMPELESYEKDYRNILAAVGGDDEEEEGNHLRCLYASDGDDEEEEGNHLRCLY